MAIDSLVQTREAIEKPYDYSRDPRLDNVQSPEPGIWVFDQPWPRTIDEVVLENVEVIYHPLDEERAMSSRKNIS